MDLGTDIWNQVTVEASQLYFEDEFGNKKSRFADTVIQFLIISNVSNNRVDPYPSSTNSLNVTEL